ncbi:hypothetical protein D3C72_1930200 [compost metagenome]
MTALPGRDQAITGPSQRIERRAERLRALLRRRFHGGDERLLRECLPRREGEQERERRPNELSDHLGYLTSVAPGRELRNGAPGEPGPPSVDLQ